MFCSCDDYSTSPANIISTRNDICTGGAKLASFNGHKLRLIQLLHIREKVHRNRATRLHCVQ